jgi:glycine dehydrogenase subunit 2
MNQISKEVEDNPSVVLDAPYSRFIGRLDKVKAARQPILRYTKVEVENKENETVPI